MADINCENLQTAILKIIDEKCRNSFELMFQKFTEKEKEVIQLTKRV